MPAKAGERGRHQVSKGSNRRPETGKSTQYLLATDFGVVRMSAKLTDYMSSIDRDWVSTAHNKRLRSKHAQRVRRELESIEQMVQTMARIEYCLGGVLAEL
jgi:hypothetical protein